MQGNQVTTIAVTLTRDEITYPVLWWCRVDWEKWADLRAIWGTKSLALKDGQDMG